MALRPPFFGIAREPRRLRFRVGFRRYRRGLFVPIPHPLEQFPHATLGIADLEGYLDPRDGFFGTTYGAIEPRRKLLLLCGGEDRVISSRLQGTEDVHTASHKDLHPSGNRFGVDVEDTGDLFAIVARIKQEDGLNALANAALGRLLVPPLQVVPLAAG